jgi:uncharacterized membrane protein HdeD (DUF308 family)
METPQRGALNFVRFVAACLIVIGVLDATLCLTPAVAGLIRHASKHAPVKILSLLLNVIPAVIGIIVLAKARAIAKWIDDQIQ